MLDTIDTTAPPPGARDPDSVEQRLRRLIAQHSSVAVALSGGVDSSVVAAVAAQELGERAVAITGVSDSLSDADLRAARALCQRVGIAHDTVITHEMQSEGYARNAPDRCYFCKQALFSAIARRAQELGIQQILDGTNADDVLGHRPGKKAADERGVLAPLLEVGATKRDVRELAERLGLPNADRPASPCLSSRIAYGLRVTPERLTRVHSAETFLRSLGFTDVRVRLHDAIARVEVAREQLALAAEHAPAIDSHLRQLGFVYVTLDLGGLRSGSLLEVLGSRRPTT